MKDLLLAHKASKQEACLASEKICAHSKDKEEECDFKVCELNALRNKEKYFLDLNKENIASCFNFFKRINLNKYYLICLSFSSSLPGFSLAQEARDQGCQLVGYIANGPLGVKRWEERMERGLEK